ncbi:uncharacterized protein FFNC_01497 [Fusarium fujikuroi]|nr:uncharacterized protein FFNC_01497 [Fusarium fujikuroi]
MTNSGSSGLETDRKRPNQRRLCPPRHREAGQPSLQRSRATNCLRMVYHDLELQSLDEAGIPNKLRRAPPLSSEPPQGIGGDRGGEVILLIIQQGDDQTCKRLDHVREYQVHVHHPAERPKSIEIQFCHVDDEDEL